VRRKKGMLIAFDGIDGAGSTTQAFLLRDWLLKRGHKAIVTSEPTDSLIGGLIKSALKKHWRCDSLTLQLLFCSDRAMHVKSEIEPALRKGYFVILDRYYYSTLAYGSLGLPLSWLLELNSRFPTPAIAFILDVPAKVAMRRLGRTRFHRELFEQERKLELIREQYKKLADLLPEAVLINANAPIKKVARVVRKLLLKFAIERGIEI